MSELEFIFRLLDFVQVPLLIVALLLAYKIGEVARGIAYIIGILLVKGFVDIVFAGNFWDFYASVPKEFKMVLGVSWYFFYTLTGTIAIFALYLLINIKPLFIRGYILLFVSALFVKVGIMFSRTLEIAYFDTDFTRIPYMYVVPALSFVIVLSVFWGLVSCYRRSQAFGERIEWS